ncbi:MAG: LysR family transcriptional regulator [Peptostreptococcaceae bacterium]
MQLNQLKYLIEVAETGSMNKASQNLFISQPNLSSAIMKLEEEFNIKIFDRNNRGVELTKEGKEFLTYAKSIINQVNNVENIYTNLCKEKKFVLEVSTVKLNNISDILIDIYNDINYYKKLKISLKETHKEKIIQDVANMDSEVGILILSNIQEKLWNNILEINKLEFNEIAKEKVYVYMGEKNSLYKKDKIYTYELKDKVCIYLVEDITSSVVYNIEFDALKFFNKDKALYFNDKETIYNFLSKTDAYAIGSVWSGMDNIKGVKGIPIAEENIEFKIGWIKRKKEELSDEAKMFIDMLCEKLKI